MRIHKSKVAEKRIGRQETVVGTIGGFYNEAW